MFTPPTLKLPENTTRAELKPCKVEMSGLATWLVMVWVGAMLIPCSMKNVPRETRKDGPRVFLNIQPQRRLGDRGFSCRSHELSFLLLYRRSGYRAGRTWPPHRRCCCRRRRAR